MAKRGATAIATVLLATGVASGQAQAEPAAVPRVVLHVRDYQDVPARDLTSAEELASRAYESVGILLEWTDGAARVASPDDRRHFDVVILTKEMTDRTAKADSLGQASPVTRRAYIYYRRILNHAFETKSDPTRVLALVLAHEVGHLLLPTLRSHTTNGLMRQTPRGRIVNVPTFDAAQLPLLRASLMARR
jgi:hypothetical protein